MLIFLPLPDIKEIKPDIKLENDCKMMSAPPLPKGKESLVKLEPLKLENSKVPEFDFNMEAAQIVQQAKLVPILSFLHMGLYCY